MGLPVACIQICILDGIATVDHHPVPHIDATVGHARRVIGADKEHQIAGLWIAGRGKDVIEPLGPQAAHMPAAVIDHPGHEAGAIKGRGRTGASPPVSYTHLDVYKRQQHYIQRQTQFHNK